MKGFIYIRLLKVCIPSTPSIDKMIFPCRRCFPIQRKINLELQFKLDKKELKFQPTRKNGFEA
jgi:hypothetical protein